MKEANSMEKLIIPFGYKSDLDLHDTQVAIKTQKAADQLKWIGAEKITGVEAYKASLKREQEEYQEQFAAAMMRMG